MSVTATIRRAGARDADAISRVIVRTIQVTNAADYPPDVVAEVVKNFTAPHVAAHLAVRQTFVAVIDDRIVGTASLDGAAVRSVYVNPDHQRRGVGALLMDAVEHLARSRSVDRITVPSSITAIGFYEKRGFAPVREEYHGSERTIVMEKTLDPAS